MKSVIFVFSLVSSLAWAETHLALEAGLRSTPRGTNIMGTVARDGLIWGTADKARPLYGYYRVGGRLGGSPGAAGFFQVAPIAPLVFEVQQSLTDRFLNSGPINCEINDCSGTISRTDYTARAVAGYGHMVFLGQILGRDIRTRPSERPVYLEQENMSVRPGQHRLFESTLLVGYKLPRNHMVGLVGSQGTLAENLKSYSSIYGLYRWNWQGLGWMAAAGTYQSNEPGLADGTSLLFSVSKRWGDTLSLF